MTLTIISGVMLPKSAMRPPEFTRGGTTKPFVIVRVAGHPRDAKQRFRTASATCGSYDSMPFLSHGELKAAVLTTTGLNPVWHEKFHLRFYNPAMACINLLVKTPSSAGPYRKDASIRGLCYAVVPLPTIQKGEQSVRFEASWPIQVKKKENKQQ